MWENCHPTEIPTRSCHAGPANGNGAFSNGLANCRHVPEIHHPLACGSALLSRAGKRPHPRCRLGCVSSRIIRSRPKACDMKSHVGRILNVMMRRYYIAAPTHPPLYVFIIPPLQIIFTPLYPTTPFKSSPTIIILLPQLHCFSIAFLAKMKFSQLIVALAAAASIVAAAPLAERQASAITDSNVIRSR